MPILIWKPTLCSLTNKSHYCSPRVLWAAGCIQQPKLLFLQHLAIPGFPPEWSYCQPPQCWHWFTVKHSKAGLQTSSHPQNSASHLLGLQSLQQTSAKLFIKITWETLYMFSKRTETSSYTSFMILQSKTVFLPENCTSRSFAVLLVLEKKLHYQN